MQTSASQLWPGTERFEIRRKLGSGSFGTIYEAMDRHYGSTVALKVLHNYAPSSLLRFKLEFRLLADLVHPNLVTLYELFSDREEWFFTMELVDGQHFLDYLRRSAPPEEISPHDDTITSPFDRPIGQAGRLAPMRARTELTLDVERLRSAFFQLAQGVRALHAARLIHRDIKPSNVLVTPVGRVTVLDFGLARELAGAPANAGPQSGELAGSPAYMSPEQWLLKPLTEASDWYSVGVMLFEALTGARPFETFAAADRVAEQIKGAPSPSKLVDGVPLELEALCRDLLQPSPKDRPSGDEVVRRLEGAGSPERRLRLVPSREERLVGRAAELAALDGALAESTRGQVPVVVLVHGRSGVGKSALVRAFARSLEASNRAFLLQGRCHEREFAPYKAFDVLVDALGRHLFRHPSRGPAPRGMRELVQLFPVLKLAAGEIPGADEPQVLDPQSIRRRALHAFKELLAHTAFGRPLVLSVNDLQWGDLDGVRLLAELLAPPLAMPLLLVASYDDEEAERSPWLAEFRQLLSSVGVPIRDVALVNLGQEEAELLALELLGDDSAKARLRAEQIARESEGSPLFVEELARHAREGAPDSEGAVPSLRELLRARVEMLPGEARRLLEVVAVAGRPLEPQVALGAAALDGTALASLTLLRTRQLLRLRPGEESAPLELSHHQLRESLLADMGSSARVDCHRRLAQALLATPDPDSEELARHLHGAGENQEAALRAFRAAEAAASALAFARAAELYGAVLEWIGEGEAVPGLPDRRQIIRRRANALVHAGRGAEAAALFLQLAEGAHREEALELRLLAAVRYLACGHQAEGTRVLVPLVEEVGLPYPATSGEALLSTAWLLLRLKLSGYAFKARPAAEAGSGRFLQQDLCWSVGKVLSNLDPLRGMPFQLRAVRYALASGEPVRVARSLTMLGSMMVWQGTPAALARGNAMLEQAEALARSTGDATAQSILQITRGATDLVLGRWGPALERFEAAIQRFQTLPTDPWDVYMARVFANNARVALGKMAEAQQSSARWYREATELGDIYARTTATLGKALPLLATRGPEETRVRLREVSELWPVEGFGVQTMYVLHAKANVDLYEGEPAEAWARLQRAWPALWRSGLLLAGVARMEMFPLRARAAIALAARDRAQRKRLLAQAEADARRLERELRCDARPLRRQLQACIARVQGDTGTALAHLVAAEEGFAGASMDLSAACVRYARGALLGGEGGEQLKASANEVFAREGIRDPRRWMAMSLPGIEA